MTDWDVDSRQLRSNLKLALGDARDIAARRLEPRIEDARRWHRIIMRGLDVPHPQLVGSFRGEPGLEGVEVAVGCHRGAPSAAVALELAAFEARLRTALEALDSLVAPGQEPDADGLAAVIDVCAWAHAEWIRIHP